ncbi:hypothetical protein DWV16_11740 [Anaerotruncus sp. AF02-27]|uniref:hypothetical protein n=1 Tax=Anaerotruncus TaxID=244127 RepID=UPI000E470CCA|nr:MULTISPECIES: hypothetical protein [Anaerotruncus]RGX54891.1 hypothetical protein DWV16_11740 [Anaerotruncus sp. AF02-27]
MKKILAMVLALVTAISMCISVSAVKVTSTNDSLYACLDDIALYDTDFELDNAYVESAGDLIIKDGKSDTVRPAKTIYFDGDGESYLGYICDRDDFFKVEASKGEGSKYVQSIELVQKKFDKNLIEVDDPSDDNEHPAGSRDWYIAVKLKDSYNDEEFKLTVKLTVKAKKNFWYCTSCDEILATKAAADAHAGDIVAVTTGGKVVYESDAFWVTNEVLEGDQDQTAGTGGYVFKPEKNEDNEVIWEDENDQIAKLSFTADSDVAKYYPKLSTKWDNSKYEEKFADQDAFIRQFVGSPKISSTSRATLELNVPYLDDDNELTVDEDEIIVYEETADGELVDVTSKGKFVTNDDDDFVFQMKTRQLGTYIFAAAPAASSETENIPEEAPEADKANPGTGF